MDKARVIAQELLDETRQVLRDREVTHGRARPNLQRTADMWAPLVGKTISAADVAVMLAMLKLARICEGDQYQRDHWADALGYLALAGGLTLDGGDDAATGDALAELRARAANANGPERRNSIPV